MFSVAWFAAASLRQRSDHLIMILVKKASVFLCCCCCWWSVWVVHVLIRIPHADTQLLCFPDLIYVLYMIRLLLWISGKLSFRRDAGLQDANIEKHACSVFDITRRFFKKRFKGIRYNRQLLFVHTTSKLPVPSSTPPEACCLYVHCKLLLQEQLTNHCYLGVKQKTMLRSSSPSSPSVFISQPQTYPRFWTSVVHLAFCFAVQYFCFFSVVSTICTASS